MLFCIVVNNNFAPVLLFCQATLESLKYGIHFVELSNEIGSKSLTFNEDLNLRPWWAPTSERNYLLGQCCVHLISDGNSFLSSMCFVDIMNSVLRDVSMGERKFFLLKLLMLKTNNCLSYVEEFIVFFLIYNFFTSNKMFAQFLRSSLFSYALVLCY